MKKGVHFDVQSWSTSYFIFLQPLAPLYQSFFFLSWRTTALLSLAIAAAVLRENYRHSARYDQLSEENNALKEAAKHTQSQSNKDVQKEKEATTIWLKLAGDAQKELQKWKSLYQKLEAITKEVFPKTLDALEQLKTSLETANEVDPKPVIDQYFADLKGLLNALNTKIQNTKDVSNSSSFVHVKDELAISTHILSVQTKLDSPPTAFMDGGKKSTQTP